ncbi:hypothetical protein UT300005_14950 [Clostridium sp. CTA-5]
MYKLILNGINVYLIIALFPINRILFENEYIFNIENIKLVVIVLGIISILDIILTNNIKKFLQFKSVLLYPILLLIISSFNSIDKLQSIKLAIVLICMSVYIINIIIKCIDGKINILFNINFGCFIFLILNYIYIYIYPNKVEYIDFRYGITLQGITGHRIHLSICCALIIIISYINLINRIKGFNKIISIFNIISCIYFIDKSKSQTAFIALLIVGLIVIINNKFYIKGSIIIFISNIVSIIYVAMIPIIERISILANVNLTLTGRTSIWKGIMEMIDMRKIGYGLGTFWGTNSYSDYYNYKYYNGGHAHNGILEMILELGIIGTIVVWICLWNNIKNLREKKLYNYIDIKFSYITLIFIFIISLAEPILFSYQYVNVFNYILLISLSFISTKKNNIIKLIK